MSDLDILALMEENRRRHEHAAALAPVVITRPGVAETEATAPGSDVAGEPASAPRSADSSTRKISRVPRKQLRSDVLADAGRKLWGELHLFALSWTGDVDAALAWLEAFRRRVPAGGCACRSEWNRLIRSHPPDLRDPDSLFAWTVDVHNAINRKLEKPEFGVEEAMRFWEGQKKS